ncbi:hypothetical protein FEM48_Zijuj12G0057200 [Ziziphus jujuba var. spinosa]|uniref:Uncharacterized protein n=1 Tax=Ziziphus jujuba var. spinosa TaxID=714518 RepID=A0A978UBI0_ZIZJJ|nr:hypothetical protein FEM48_Zijuj12G0057200 [Ziziphus jujuba var. spinosa]
MVSFELNDQKKIGAGLTTFGIIFSFLGLIFLFDKKLLAVGNFVPFLFFLLLACFPLHKWCLILLYCHFKSDPLPLRLVFIDWIEVHHAIPRKTAKYKGNDIVWCWLLVCRNRLAYIRHDFGRVWFLHALQFSDRYYDQDRRMPI